MNDKFLKPYNPTDTEDAIYELWEKSGYFNPDNLPKTHREVFSMVLPPPNVTGQLHIGHAMMLAIEDIMSRYQRARGKKVLWIPGTDHAAIATQTKVEGIIYKEEKMTRHDLGRDEFLKRVENFAQESHDRIINQTKKMGCSLDWSREAYTLDDMRSLAVRTAFKKMFTEGLIYRGARIVNWDPRLQTTVSDDELVYKEETVPFYYLKYGPFIIGTARPETKFGDKYVVMHPDDVRYKEFAHGQKIDLEWINGPIAATVIKDESIDMAFGTGVMTITPWHDATDFDIAERHNLEKEQIIDLKGKLMPLAGEFAGLHIKKARAVIVEKLTSKGLVEKIDENYVHNVATSERSEEKVEPQIMRQWFVSVNTPIKSREGKTLKELMREPVEDGSIEIIPERFGKTYYHWIDNLRDWCISRQIWYGHRIPVWYRGDEIHCGTEAPDGDGWEQDSDTLDTWFSSGLWTFSTLGWPEETIDLKTFHPTSMLETGYDILFFWVARMILMSQYLLGEIPFKKVYLHGLVRDEKGRKLSKSLGNAGDPLAMIEKYGADALRMALIVGTSPGNDSKISEDKVKGYKHFANKVWNVTRYILSQENTGEIKQELIDEFNAFASEVTANMENNRFDIAADQIYHYIWRRLADEIREESKGKPEYGKTLHYILSNCLKLLHPFMPFLTEEIWQNINSEKGLLMIEAWPVPRQEA
jgi:valyl-tRNA synthetase